MGVYKFSPPMSGRMGILWTLASISDAALIEYGCMGHMLYSRMALKKVGISNACKLYSTHIDETDISLGSIDRLEATIESVIKNDAPKVIFLTPSSVPTIIGTDLVSICKEIQPKYEDTLLIPFEFGGFDICSHRGIEETLLKLVQVIPKNIVRPKKPIFNIIGSCTDMFRFHADSEEIKRIIKGAFGMEVNCVLTSDTTVNDIKNIGKAHINLVIREEGIKCSEYLKEKFGIPYLVGRPYGVEGTLSWLGDIEEVIGIEVNKTFLEKEKLQANNQIISAMPILSHVLRDHSDEAKISIGGHFDVVKGVLDFAEKELHLKKAVCFSNCKCKETKDIPFIEEESWSQSLLKEKGIFMTSGEALKWSGKNLDLQISNPDVKWRLNVYESPFVGFRGAINLLNIWLNEFLDSE